METKTKENLDKEMRAGRGSEEGMGPGKGKLQAPGLSLSKPQALTAGRGHDNIFNHERHRVRGKNS